MFDKLRVDTKIARFGGEMDRLEGGERKKKGRRGKNKTASRMILLVVGFFNPGLATFGQNVAKSVF